jgi:hypothetical protein
MGMLFDRKCELHIFVGAMMHKIKGLHMAFDITATSESKPNTAKIKVFNLSASTRSLISTDLKGLEFWAGYGEDVGMIFRGSYDPEVSTIRHVKSGADWETEIEIGDGSKEFSSTFFDRSYPAGTPVVQIFNDVTRSMGLPIVMEFTDAVVLSSSAVFTGRASKVLDGLCSEYACSWSIQHGVVEVVPFTGTPKADSAATLLSPSTGLVGTPTFTEDGLEVKTLLMFTLKPTRLIKIDPVGVETRMKKLTDAVKEKKKKTAPPILPRSSGVYRIDRIQYSGDNMGGDFNCVVNCDLPPEEKGKA